MVRPLWIYNRLQVYKSFILICIFIAAYYVFRNGFAPINRLVADKRYNEGGSGGLLPVSGNSTTRILCLILTSDRTRDKMAAVNNTWVKRCDHHVFIYGNNSKTTGDKFALKTSAKDTRGHLTAKVRFALKHAYKINNERFDWILKCDDDTYVIMENLKYLLSHVDSNTSGYLGFHMKTSMTSSIGGYMSGGAGYVISSRALGNLVNIGFQNGVCRQDGGNEDEEIGICLAKSNVSVIQSLDVTGKETFHPSNLKSFISPEGKTSVEWLKKYSWNKSPYLGPACCSKYSVSFHYVSPQEQYLFEHLLYNMNVYNNREKGDDSDGNII